MKMYLNEAQSLVDNFDRIEKFMQFQSPDDFYFVQIIKRYKDNPSLKPKTHQEELDQNYRAGAWYRKGYRIHSAQELESYRNEIIQLCNADNARAYITINPRSEAETNKQVIKVRSQLQRSLGNRYNPKYDHTEDIVAAQPKDGPSWKGQRLKLFIDIDTPNQKVWDECIKMINMVGIQIEDQYVSPSGGLHIILPNKEDKNMDYLKGLLMKFDGWMNKGRLAMCHPNVDGKLILYSNVKTKGY